MSTTAQFKNPEPFQTALKSLRSDQSPLTWIVVTHENNDPATLTIQGQGDGSFDDFKAAFSDDRVSYGLFRTTTSIPVSDVLTTHAVKFVYVYYLGSKVGFVKRGRLGVVKGSVTPMFQPYHVDFDLTTLAELTWEAVDHKIREAAGTSNNVRDRDYVIGRQERGFTARSTFKADGQHVEKPVNVTPFMNVHASTTFSPQLSRQNSGFGSTSKLAPAPAAQEPTPPETTVLAVEVTEHTRPAAAAAPAPTGFRSGAVPKPAAAAAPRAFPTQAYSTQAYTKPSSPLRQSSQTQFGAGGVAAVVPDAVRKSLGVVISDEVRQAVQKVRAGEQGATWMMATYQDNNVNRPVVLLAQGTGDVEEMKQSFPEGGVAYAFTRVTDVIDGHPTTKFVFVNWISAKAGIMMKAKVSTHKGAVQDAFAPCHVDFVITELREVSQQIVMSKVGLYSGSARAVI